MRKRRDDEIRVVEINAVLEHLRQVKEDTVKMIESLQRERTRKKASIRKAQKRR